MNIFVATNMNDLIPKTLDEALNLLEKLLTKEDLEKIIKSKNLAEYHHCLGRSIRNNWKLWYSSDLAIFFNKLGIVHADDMSGIILDSLQRKMKNLPIDLDGQIRYYVEYYKQ
jgi:hypothetical protein